MFIFLIFQISTSICSFVHCPKQIQQDCDGYYQPVCAYSFDDKITQEFWNHCEACKISTTLYYYEGECKELINNIETQRMTNEQQNVIQDCDEKIRYLTDCSNIENSVCGVFVSTEKCTTCQKEYYNSCVACSDYKVDYYYDGYCKNGESEIIYCPTDRPSNCTENGLSVCSQTTAPCTTSDCTQISSSWCFACQNLKIVSYYQGSCSEYLEFTKNVNIMEEITQKCQSYQLQTCTETVQQVCATETCNDDGSTCQKTYNNSCQACQNSKVISYLPFSCFSFKLTILSIIIYILF
ncbi:unnamed protein product [Paramecium sonneborni]|uniref:Kazal-like domain-containing protein n=1 Tax=Paramecium sonneborni TaxID=65129 RepID=A0A8S1QZB1_9CILI|nr:unnamed protein product [Paramecium sonneborni]